MGSWQVPSSQQGSDSDFGTTPTFFNAVINGKSAKLVGAANKNGIFYTFKRDALGNGPIWEDTIAIGGDCPQCGNGSISPAAWNGSTLYAAGGNTTIKGKSCAGSVRAINPATGAYIWQACFTDGPIIAAVSGVPGVSSWVKVRTSSLSPPLLVAPCSISIPAHRFMKGHPSQVGLSTSVVQTITCMRSRRRSVFRRAYCGITTCVRCAMMRASF